MATSSVKGDIAPPFLAVPRDEEAYEYAQSFDAAANEWDAARAFLAEYGFVVVRNVLSPAECAATRDAMFGAIEAAVPEFRRDDMATWAAWESNSYGMLGRDPLFAPQLLRNRQHPNVVRAFAELLGDQGGPMLVSHDRWALYRPTSVCAAWATTSNVHIDLNPWRYASEDAETLARRGELSWADVRDFVHENNLLTRSMGLPLQGVLNLLDNREEDGGFVVVPGFTPAFFEQWLRAQGPMQARDADPGAYRFPDNCAVAKRAQRVPMAEGSMVVWPQCTAHGSQANRSDRPRMAMFLKMNPSASMPVAQRAQRAEALRRAFAAAGFRPEEVTRLGRQVFFGEEN